MKSRVLAIITALLAIGLLMATVGCEDNRDTVMSQLPTVADGTVKLRLEAEFTADQMSQISSDVIQKALEHGWIKTKKGYAKYYPLEGVKLMARDQEALTDSNGYYALSHPVQSSQMELSYNGYNLPSSAYIISEKNDRVEFIIEKKFAEASCCSDIDQTNMHKAPSLTATRSIPCNDYNGFLGNFVNYPSTDPRAWINFLFSDCDWAFSKFGCWQDHLPNRACNGAVNCSPAIGHSMNAHRHTKFKSPKG